MSERSIATPRRTKAKLKHSLLTRIFRSRYLYLALTPALILLLIFEWYPAISAFYNSFFWWNGGKLHTFVGWENYSRLFQDRAFKASLGNLALFLLFRIVMQAIFPFIAAELIVNLRSERWSNWWKTIFVFPMVVPSILLYLIWRFVPETIQLAAANYSPALIANYVYDLVKEFNSFYQQVSILGETDEQQKVLRVQLSKKVSEVIESGFKLLGIDVPERM